MSFGPPGPPDTPGMGMPGQPPRGPMDPPPGGASGPAPEGPGIGKAPNPCDTNGRIIPDSTDKIKDIGRWPKY